MKKYLIIELIITVLFLLFILIFLVKEKEAIIGIVLGGGIGYAIVMLDVQNDIRKSKEKDKDGNKIVRGY